MHACMRACVRACESYVVFYVGMCVRERVDAYNAYTHGASDDEGGSKRGASRIGANDAREELFGCCEGWWSHVLRGMVVTPVGCKVGQELRR